MDDKIEILVHPFDSEIYGGDQKFGEAISKKLDAPGKLIVLTSNPEHTRERLKNRNATIIVSGDYHPAPLVGWKAYNQIISPYSEVIISGAELKLDEQGNPFDGCVMCTYEETNHHNKRLDTNSCWISSF